MAEKGFMASLRAAMGMRPLPCAPQGAVYQVFPGSFADSDGDGIGDLRGIEKKADYIASLGVDAVWLTPFYPASSYHGYDVTDYCAVSAQMGDLHAFDRMLRALHRRGLRVIIDLVFNHTGSEHPWFRAATQALAQGTDSPYIAYYNFSRCQGANMYAVSGAEGWYYLGEFGYGMPDLNLDSEQVRAELEKIMRFWLARGVDGFRLDAVIYYYRDDTERNTAFLTWLVQAARKIRRDVYIVGEAWTDDDTIARLYDSGINSLFHFSLAGYGGGIAEAIRCGGGCALAFRIAGSGFKGTDAAFLSNHDMDRSVCMLPGEIGPRRAAAAAYLLAPGNPYVYYGEELGMTGSGRDENKRLPMLWGEQRYTCQPPKRADQEQALKMGVVQQEREKDSMLCTYRRLITLRRKHPEIGGVRPEAVDIGHGAVYALRYGRTAVLINMHGAPACFPWAGRARIAHEGGVMLEGGYMMLAPWAVAVIEDI